MGALAVGCAVILILRHMTNRQIADYCYDAYVVVILLYGTSLLVESFIPGAVVRYINLNILLLLGIALAGLTQFLARRDRDTAASAITTYKSAIIVVSLFTGFIVLFLTRPLPLAINLGMSALTVGVVATVMGVARTSAFKIKD